MPDPVFTPEEVVKDPPATDKKPADDKPPAQVAAPDPDPILTGDHIPEKYRGKKASAIAEENARLEAQLAEAKKAPPQQPQQVDQRQKGPNEMTLEELEDLGYRNPVKASAIMMQRYSEPIVRQVQANARQLAEQSVQALPHYKRFEKEIKEHVAKAAPDAQGNPELHKRVYEMVVGGHHDELIREAATGGTGLPGGGAPKKEPEKAELTAEQKEVAKKFNMTEDDYRANM